MGQFSCSNSLLTMLEINYFHEMGTMEHLDSNRNALLRDSSLTCQNFDQLYPVLEPCIACSQMGEVVIRIREGRAMLPIYA